MSWKHRESSDFLQNCVQGWAQECFQWKICRAGRSVQLSSEGNMLSQFPSVLESWQLGPSTCTITRTSWLLAFGFHGSSSAVQPVIKAYSSLIPSTVTLTWHQTACLSTASVPWSTCTIPIVPSYNDTGGPTSELYLIYITTFKDYSFPLSCHYWRKLVHSCRVHKTCVWHSVKVKSMKIMVIHTNVVI